MKPVQLFITLVLVFCIHSSFAQGPDWKWAVTAGGVIDAATDVQGNIYLAGQVKDSVRIGNTRLTTSGDYDLYIVKFTPSGSLLWVKQTQGNNNEFATGIALDDAGNIYLHASFKETGLPLVFGGFSLKTFGSDDYLFAKYDNNGNLLWARTAGGPDMDLAFSDAIACDGAGNSVITGRFNDYCVFGNDTLHGSSSDNIVIAKYDANGDVIWFKGAGGKKSDRGFNVTRDAMGNLFVTGYYTDTAWFDNVMVTAGDGQAHTFLAKYDNAGQLQWAKTTGGDFGANLVVDAAGYIYLTGTRTGSVFENTTLTGPGSSFLAKYDSNGNLVWAKAAGRTGWVGLPDVDIDPLGNIYFSADSVIAAKYNGNGVLSWEVINTGHNFQALLASDKNGNIYAAGSIVNGKINIGKHTVLAPGYLAKLSPFPVSVPVLANGIKMILYPNPATGLLQVHGIDFNGYAVTDMTGHKLLFDNKAKNTDAIDVSSLPIGNYMLHLQTAGKSTSLKFTKQ